LYDLAANWLSHIHPPDKALLLKQYGLPCTALHELAMPRAKAIKPLISRYLQYFDTEYRNSGTAVTMPTPKAIIPLILRYFETEYRNSGTAVTMRTQGTDVTALSVPIPRGASGIGKKYLFRSQRCSSRYCENVKVMDLDFLTITEISWLFLATV